MLARVVRSGAGATPLGGAAVRSISNVPTTKRSSDVTFGNAGRMAVSGATVTVFGATGFLGRYVVDILANFGCQVVVPYRGADMEVRHLKLMGDHGRVMPFPYSPRDRESIREVVQHSQIVINLAGKFYETKHIVPWLVNYTMDDVHVKMPLHVAEVSKEMGVERFIHTSALDASATSPSEFCRSKAAGEAAVLSVYPDATIIRPSIMYGHEDRFLNWYAMWALEKGPVLLPDGGHARVQPVCVEDVALAYAKCLRAPHLTTGKTYNLAGREVYTQKEIVEYVFAMTRREPRVLDVPGSLMRLVGRALGYMPAPWTTADEVERMLCDITEETAARDARTLGIADLEITPRDMETYAFNFLHRFRPGGHFLQTEAEYIPPASHDPKHRVH